MSIGACHHAEGEFIYMKKIAVLGCGTVGSGVVEVFYKNRSSIQKKSGCDMDIKYIYLRRAHPELLTQYPDMHLEEKFCFDFDTIANDPEINIVVEVMGGIEPAYHFVKTCLQKGKSVATANKELIANKGAELLSIAKQNHVNILFEASVGGGIPIIRPLHQCLGANEIDDIQGILNGTTNFILTKMIRENMNFADALSLAQKLGYAEADPTADVEGLDTCRKICILASLAYGKQINPQWVSCEGISKITAEDVEYAKDWGGVIKLIGKATRDEQTQKIAMMVAPMFVPQESQLSTVDDVFNGILVTGDATGEVLFYGKGAGKLPTASAVMSDVIDCAKATDTIDTLYWEDGDGSELADLSLLPSRFYLRFQIQYSQQLSWLEHSFCHAEFLARKNQPQTEAALVTDSMTPEHLDLLLQSAKKEGITLLSKIVVL